METKIEIKPPRVLIPRLIHQKIMFMVDNKDDCECSGLMQIETLGNGDLLVTDTVMTKQVNSSAETELDPNGIGKAMFLFKDKPGFLRGHWHSHVNMEVFWSSTDREMILKNAKHAPWFIHLVVNRKREMLAMLYVKEPIEMFLNHTKVEIYDEIPETAVAAWCQEYQDNVEIKTWPVTTTVVAWQGAEWEGFLDKRELPLVQGGHVVSDDAPEDADDALEELIDDLGIVEDRIDQAETALDGTPENDYWQTKYWALIEEKDRLERAIMDCKAKSRGLLAGGLQ